MGKGGKGEGRRGGKGAMRRKGIRKRDREAREGGRTNKKGAARLGDRRRKYRCMVRRGFVDKLYTQIGPFQRLLCLSNIKIIYLVQIDSGHSA